MIITKTPFRMSFFGGGTDMPEFFSENGGAVLSTTFDKYCYVTVRHIPQFFEYSTEVVYSKIERVSNADELEHPLVRNAMRFCDMHELRVGYDADLPARSGLGTSSSFAVGLLNAFHSLKGSFASKKKLAEEAIFLEREMCAESGGWQDQIAAAYGGLNRISFQGESFEVNPVIVRLERKKMLEERLLLFFTGFTRFSSDVQREQRYSEKTARLRAMLQLVDEAERVLTDKSASLETFGELLDESWNLKRGLGANISTDPIDDLYRAALRAGATGGKLLGAGGGGFLLFYCEPEVQANVRDVLDCLMEVPFEFEDEGTRVIHYSPEEYETTL
ncbi:kinase [Eggerthella sp. YY7918]|uniref:GHMP family kinase ATP-binding protein n=1 Tax=Eggerthella sp. (strain YY7918) TaxID=502558 RepID=UPI0002170FD6|nr:kinase [Eggerthella sp. YY7918]BAK43918.1 predicted kinase related to galactokinase [Eggerthella sp. YY7918]